MALERIIELPEEAAPVASEVLAIDGATTRKATIQDVVDAGAPIASEAEARAGANATKRMTPLTTAQFLDEQIGDTVQEFIGPAGDAGTAVLAQALAGDVRDLLRVPLRFDARAVASAITIEADTHVMLLDGWDRFGDGYGGLFIDTNNGNNETFTTNAGARTWYRVPDVNPARIKPLNPFASPVAGIREVDPLHFGYRGLPAFAFELDGGVDFFAYRLAPGHGNENPGTRLLGRRTLDTGYTFARPSGPANSGPMEVLIYRDPDTDVRNAVCGKMNGKLGILAARVYPDDTHKAPVFLSTTDMVNAATWSSAVLSGSAVRWNFHGKIEPWPTSAGGDDANGFIAYFYRVTGEAIGSMRSSDNGANWTENPNMIPYTGVALSEMDVVRLGTSNRWLMFIRTGGNLYYAKSTNMTTWTTPVDTGFLLKGNPPAVLYRDGSVWFITFSRDGQQLLSEGRNAMVYMRGDPERLWDSSGADGFGPLQILSNMAVFPTGYPSFINQDDRILGLFTTENYTGSTQSTDGVLNVVSGDSFVRTPRPPKPHLVPSLALNYWPRGTSVAVGANRMMVTPGITAARGGGVAGMTVSQQPGDDARYCLRGRRDDGNSSNQPLTLNVTLPQARVRDLAGKHMTFTGRVRKSSGFSAASSFLNIHFRLSTDPAEQPVTLQTGFFTTADAPFVSAVSGMNLTEEWQYFQITPGVVRRFIGPGFAYDVNALTLRISFTPVGTATNDWFEIEMMKWEQGDGPTQNIPPDLGVEKRYGDQFLQIFEWYVPASTTVYVPFRGGSMYPAGVMDVVSTAGTVANVTSNGFTLQNATGSPITPTITAQSVF